MIPYSYEWTMTENGSRAGSESNSSIFHRQPLPIPPQDKLSLPTSESSSILEPNLTETDIPLPLATSPSGNTRLCLWRPYESAGFFGGEEMGNYGFDGFFGGSIHCCHSGLFAGVWRFREVGTLGLSLYRLGCIFFIGLERFVDLLRRYVGLGHVLWPH